MFWQNFGRGKLACVCSRLFCEHVSDNDTSSMECAEARKHAVVASGLLGPLVAMLRRHMHNAQACLGACGALVCSIPYDSEHLMLLDKNYLAFKRTGKVSAFSTWCDTVYTLDVPLLLVGVLDTHGEVVLRSQALQVFASLGYQFDKKCKTLWNWRVFSFLHVEEPGPPPPCSTLEALTHIAVEVTSPKLLYQ